jgi:hypothetical protein
MIIKKSTFRRKYIVNITFHEKEYCKSDVILYLDITNSIPESLKSYPIYKIHSYF